MAGWCSIDETLLRSQEQSASRGGRQINFLKVPFTVAVYTKVSEGTAGSVRQRRPVTRSRWSFGEDTLNTNTGGAGGKRCDFIQSARTRAGAVVRNLVNASSNPATATKQIPRFDVTI